MSTQNLDIKTIGSYLTDLAAKLDEAGRHL
jgi:hypothetical protein